MTFQEMPFSSCPFMASRTRVQLAEFSAIVIYQLAHARLRVSGGTAYHSQSTTNKTPRNILFINRGKVRGKFQLHTLM